MLFVLQMTVIADANFKPFKTGKIVFIFVLSMLVLLYIVCVLVLFKIEFELIDH